MELDTKKVNEFILKAMRQIFDKGVVYITADPPRRPSDIMQYTPGIGDKCYGFHVDLQLETGRLRIAVVHSEYAKVATSEAQCYMAIREDVERIIRLFHNVEL